MRVAREEIFGPVVTLIPFSDEDEAVRIANGTPFGLVAAVFSQDSDRALRVSRQIRAGAVFVNNYVRIADRYRIRRGRPQRIRARARPGDAGRIRVHQNDPVGRQARRAALLDRGQPECWRSEDHANLANHRARRALRDSGIPERTGQLAQVTPGLGRTASPTSATGASRRWTRRASTWPCCRWSHPASSNWTARRPCAWPATCNDELAAAVGRYPDRLAGFAALPISAPDAAADELERAVRELGFVGAVINGHCQGRLPGRSATSTRCSTARRTLNVPIYLHPTIPPAAVIESCYGGFLRRSHVRAGHGGVGLAHQHRHARAAPDSRRRVRPPPARCRSSSGTWARRRRSCCRGSTPR